MFKARTLNVSEGGMLLDQIPHFPEEENINLMVSLPQFPFFKNYNLEKLKSFNSAFMPKTELFNTSMASGLAIALAIVWDASSEKESASG